MTAPSSHSEYPQVRMKPKTDTRAIRHGFPWVYSNQLVLDRRTRKIAPGSIVVLEDEARTPLALAAFNAGSRISVRVLDRNLQAGIDVDWFAARINRALALRERLYDAPFYRLIHAEGDGLPGIVVDRFGDTLVLQPNAAWAEALLDPLTAALAAIPGVTTILKNAEGRTRGLEGLDNQSGVLRGTAPDAPVHVPMNGATYLADLTGGQKTGLFYDQRENHAFAARLAREADVLDVFSHVGGFALAALAGGARAALCVDGSAAALELAGAGAVAAGFTGFSTRRGDAFEVMAALQGEDRQFDLVVCDPPAFAPNKQALDAGLRAYERVARLAAPLVRTGGALVLCSCSHAADLAKFHLACTRGIGRAGRHGALIHTGFAGPDHPRHPMLPETGYLKALTFAL